MKDLSVIVVSYNTRELLRTCLTALRASLERSENALPGGWEVVVVDNGSGDGSPEMVRASFPSIRLLALGENRGFAAANNLAIRETDSRYLLFLNPDTEVLGDAPAALQRFLEEHPRAGAAGGQLLNPDLTFQHACFRFPTLPMSLFDVFPLNHRLVNSRLNGRYPRSWYVRPFPIDHPLGASMIVRREVVESLGGFDEGYFMYCEEVDWCLRMRQAGWEVWYTPAAQIIHHGAASTGQSAGPMLVQLHRSRDRFFRRHYGPLFAWAAHQVVRLGMVRASGRARRQAARGGIDPTELTRQLGVFREVARGWRA